MVGGSCVASTSFVPPAATLNVFNLEVRCQSSTHTEGPPVSAITVYRLTSIASTGTYGTLDYVQRRIEATVSDNPP